MSIGIQGYGEEAQNSEEMLNNFDDKDYPYEPSEQEREEMEQVTSDKRREDAEQAERSYEVVTDGEE